MKKQIKKIPGARAAFRTAQSARRRLTDVVGARATARSHDAGNPLSDHVTLARVEWRDQGATPFLVERARSLSQSSVAWGLLPERAWPVFCGVLLEAGDPEAAERIVRTALAKLPDGGDVLATCLPVARFARDLGVRSDAVERAAASADVLAANRDANAFARLVAGRTVAVVGNGPGNLGSGRGAEVDAHDVVIRFNNFPQGFEADYGARTDVWVRGAHRDVRDRFALDEFSLVLWEMDFFRNLLEVPAHGEILYRDTRFSPEKVAHVDTATKLALRRASGLLLPTSGAQVLWMLHRELGALRDVDVYGFSTLDGHAEHGHYFDALGDMGSRHDVDGEGAFLRSLLGEDAGPGAPGLGAPGLGAPASGASGASDAVTVRGGSNTPAEDLAPRGEVTVFSCAYREYDPARGKTGGPAGVLATQQAALGDEHRGQQLAYLFQGPEKARLRSRLRVQLAGLSAKVSDIVVGAEAVRSDPAVRHAVESGRRTLFVCHELGSAYGAYLLGAPYVLVYHQQGSTLQEMRSNGRKPTAHEVAVANRLERIVLGNARRVFFPSLGARDTLRATAELGDLDTVRFADHALYNTVSAVDHVASDVDRSGLLAKVRRELGLPAKDASTDVFVSVGDFNQDKGLDRVPALLERHAKLSGRRVVWVAVGARPELGTFADLEKRRKGWGFEARLVGERMTHDRLLALLDYADYYVMLHRRSIFDLATLEAMRAGKPLILSPVGGNLEVDLDGNVLFVTDDTRQDACRALALRDRAEWGERNRRVFEEHFSLDRFAGRYRAMLDEQLDALLGETSSDDAPEHPAAGASARASADASGASAGAAPGDQRGAGHTPVAVGSAS